MPERLRFHLDEHGDPAVALALRSHGVGASTTLEARLQGTDDEVQAAHCQAEERVIVTHDADFLRLAASRADHAGIAYCHQQARTIGQIIRTLVLMYEALTPQDMRGKVEYL